jgi:hypothetical protein
MSLFDSASLVVTPNGQKAGKLYSIKPTDGSGDLSVVRATSATRVDANGLVEIPRTNLVLQSQTFDNASWSKTAATITANASTAPDGTLTADKFIPNTSATNHAIGSNNFALGTNTISVYAKMDGYRYLVILSATANASFDLMNGVVANNSGGGFVSYSITNVGNGWYRCILTVNTTSISSMFISGGSSSASAFFNGAGDGTSGILIWGAQVEAGNVATEYIPTIASIRTKFAGITQDGGSASNIPRLDYTNGSCPSILVEPQRTNLFSFSEQFDDASWSKTNATITANSTVSPSGNLTADTITNNIGTTGSILKQITVANNSDTYNSSFFVKKQSGFLVFQFRYLNGVTPVGCAIHFDKLTGAFLNVSASFGFTGTPVNIKVESYGDYFRFSYSLANNSTLNTVLRIEIQPHRGTSLGNLSQTNGNAIMWGAQLEVGSYATSYIPTVAASVTRNADVISKTGISSLIGQTEGTILLDYIPKSNYPLAEQNLLTLYNSSNADNNNIQIFIANSGNIAVYILSSGTLQSNLNTGVSSLTSHKIAISYANNDVAVYIDGVQVGTDTSITVPTLNSIILNNYAYGNYMSASAFKNVTLWKERLTNDQLAQLTTL